MLPALFQRLLSQFGLGYYLPTSNELGMSGSNAPETDGQAEVAFLPGKKAQIEAETEENQDERRKNLTDNSLVWPGRTDAVNFQNDESVDYRISLTITDLEPSYYMRRPAIGGEWQQDGSVLLHPGQQTKFEILFAQPPNMENAARRGFSYVLTRFDPRRANDPGEVLGDEPMRWVPMPKASDLRIAANPPVVIARPWRRQALFNLEFSNRSQLPPTVSLNVLRGENKAKLDTEPEQVATISHSLPSLTQGVWRLIIPPPAVKGSYLATVNGTAKVANGTDYALALSKPVFVRYVPWLRALKDWLFLLGSLFLLLMIVFGFPAYRGPVVRLEAKISRPPKGVPGDVGFKVIPMNGEQETTDTQQATLQPDGTFTFTLPARLMGYRPFFGWGRQKPYRFHVRIETPGPPIYEGFPTIAKPAQGSEFEVKPPTSGYFDDWTATVVTRPIEPPWKPGDPHIDACTPDVVKPGVDETFTLIGSSFGENAGAVKFDDKPASRIISWNDKKIVVLMLAVALTKGPHGIAITRNGETASSSAVSVTVNEVATPPPPPPCDGPDQPPCPDPDCGKTGHPPCKPPKLEPPKITGVFPPSVQEGQSHTITIHGTGFEDSDKIKFQSNGKDVTVTPTWSAKSVTLSVPPLRRGHCSIEISNATGASNSVRLTVKSSQPPGLKQAHDDMMRDFKDFFIRDFKEAQDNDKKQIVSDEVKTSASKALGAIDSYDKTSGENDLSKALRAMVSQRLHPNDSGASLNEKRLPGLLAEFVVTYRNPDWKTAFHEDKVNQLLHLADGKEDAELRDYALRAAAFWWDQQNDTNARHIEEGFRGKKGITNDEIRGLH